MLARVNLYLKKWSAADSAATAVINSGQFSLVPLPMVPEFPPNVNPDSDAFSANSVEAILQFETVNVRPWATAEGDAIEPSRAGGFPGFILENSVINGFESNDLRRSAWVDSIVFNGATYYYPTKYKVWRGASGNITEYYMVLRFAEQYLVRAEAEANGAGGGPGSAIADLNIIRTRAGLSPLSDTTGDISSAIKQEWRNEFFAEWGHRWLDLKRWGMALSTLDTIPIKGSNINNNQLLYPIPLPEIQDDPNLIQNPGYTSH
ncbi:MAG TPA: RagB/SusD family nutrient uptake outer membrane protein, partial [Puia sp.]|nr:RagB/SusD family nutrient uptake outer membrane protein [Puia sp.]